MINSIKLHQVHDVEQARSSVERVRTDSQSKVDVSFPRPGNHFADFDFKPENQ
jgi:hypothetical protein